MSMKRCPSDAAVDQQNRTNAPTSRLPPRPPRSSSRRSRAPSAYCDSIQGRNHRNEWMAIDGSEPEKEEHSHVSLKNADPLSPRSRLRRTRSESAILPEGIRTEKRPEHALFGARNDNACSLIHHDASSFDIGENGVSIMITIKIDKHTKTAKWYKNFREIEANDNIIFKENPEAGEFSLCCTSFKNKCNRNSQSPNVKRRFAYSEQDDNVIVQFVYKILLDEKFDLDPLKEPLWVLFQTENQEIGRKHSTVSLMYHFKRVILPRMHNMNMISGQTIAFIYQRLEYQLSQEQQEQLRRMLPTITFDEGKLISYDAAKKRLHEEDKDRELPECTGFVGFDCDLEWDYAFDLENVKDDGWNKAPKLLEPMESVHVPEKDRIVLRCRFSGEPKPSIKWFKDGERVFPYGRVQLNEKDDGWYELIVDSATRQDIGGYRCMAENIFGSARTTGEVSVIMGAKKPIADPDSQKDGRALNAKSSSMYCEKVDGFPLPELTWHKDGSQLQPSDRPQMSISPDGVARLTIPSCITDDEGIYRVIATNPSGSAHDKGNAIVKKAPGDRLRPSAEREIFDANKAPKLLEPMESVRVPEKDRIVLRCRFSGEPKPSIKWFKDGERVFPYGRLQLNEKDDGWCELIVDSAARQDIGGYRCVAENTFGSARTTGEVSVIMGAKKPIADLDSLKDGKAPGFSVPLTVKRAKPGESVVFECVPFGNPFPAIKWLKDGIELVPDSKIRMEEGPDKTQRLILDDVQFMSEGFYRCVATNEHGTASTKAELNIDGDRMAAFKAPVVEEPPEECKPRIRRGLHNMSIHQGSVVEMIVCATGIPTPTVKWFKDGVEIENQGPEAKRVFFTDDRGIHHLVILNVEPEDEGEYALEATNKLGSARTEGLLSVIIPRSALLGPDDRHGMPFPPGFVRQLKNKHVFNKMPTIFDCLVVGHPAPDVEWFHNGKRIVPDGRITIQRCGGGSHALIIMDTNMDDAGEYVAIAKNIHGTATSSAILDVTIPFLDNIKFTGEIDVTPYLTEEYGFKKINYASLPMPPDRGPFIKEVTGHYLTLSWIPTKRAPPRYPQVTYAIEIRELPEKQWTLLDYNIPEPVCKVRNLELGKSYQFRVRAENIYGISDPSPASPPSRLMAPPQPVLDKNKRIIPLLDPYAQKALDLAYAEQYACAPWFAPGVVERRYCAENDTITIILNVSGYPDPEITWKFRGQDIDSKGPLSKCRVFTYGGTETTLTITSFSRENVGQYSCIAKNQYGDAQQNLLVEMAERPNFLLPLTDRTFSNMQPLKLDVKLEGTPFPELKWLKDFRPLVQSSRVRFAKDELGSLCSLIIENPLWRDSGIYSVVASNAAGQATTACTVTVEADGDFNDAQILPKSLRRSASAPMANGHSAALAPRRFNGSARKVRDIYEIDEEDEQQVEEQEQQGDQQQA